MKILISGENSQLGNEFKKLITNQAEHNFFFTNSKTMDLMNKNSIEKTILEIMPDIIVNFSGYTNVDGAEDNKDDAFSINEIAPGLISKISSSIGANFIHISTDYVFGGQDKGPYNTEALADPINIYGNSKLNGEVSVLKNCPKSIIIRTSSIFSVYNDNFVKTITNKLINNESINVVDNQKINITYAKDLSEAILTLIIFNKLEYIFENNPKRIINYTNTGYTSWYEVACHIKSCLSSDLGQVLAINSKEWSSRAKRPNDSRLMIDYGLFKFLNIELFDWKNRVSGVVGELISNRN